MMGLERLLANLYGSTPQIDMDLQIARARVGQPQLLDIPALADGCKRNNVGVAMIVVQVFAEVEGDTVTLQPTGQSFRLASPAEPGRRRLVLKFKDWGSADTLRAEILPELPGP